MQLDYTNRPVPEGETPNTLIKVWEITPSLSDDYDALWVRGWQEMLDRVREIAELRLERDFEEIEAEGLDIRIRLVTVSLEEYEGAVES